MRATVGWAQTTCYSRFFAPALNSARLECENELPLDWRPVCGRSAGRPTCCCSDSYDESPFSHANGFYRLGRSFQSVSFARNHLHNSSRAPSSPGSGSELTLEAAAEGQSPALTMTSVSHVTAMYATKRRRRNTKNVKTVSSKDSHSKSNPSKRHRERLNQELDTLASLLPFEQSVLSKLDKLSILRLSVSYLRTKSYFQAALAGSKLQQQQLPRHRANLQATHHHHHHHHHHNHQQQQYPQRQQQLDPSAAAGHQQSQYPAELRTEGDLIVQALNGFLLILTCDGEVFYTSHTVETYLGFHQSDICHQSVYELVHSEDREELMQQLKWNSMIPAHGLTTASSTSVSASQSTASSTVASNPSTADGSSSTQTADQQKPANNKSPSQMSLQEILASAEHRHLLERNFTVRFRCLLDNTSGFLRLDIRGRIKVLHGQQNQQNLGNSASNNVGNKSKGQQQQHNLEMSQQSQREPMLAFFGVCIPFGPPSLLEMPSKDSVFKSKHRLDLSLISMDSRGKQLLGLNDLTSIFVKQEPIAPANAPLSTTATTTPTGNVSPVGASGSGATTPSSGKQVKQETQKTSTLQHGNTNNGGGGKSNQGISAYDLVHQDDLSYMASAHQELLKTGASGLIAYRMITQEGKHQWLQTSAKLYYKNSKPDFILCTHRPLMEEEGRDLLGKRTMDFKVTYLDVGLSSINDRIMACDKFSSLQALGATTSASVNRGGTSSSSSSSACSKSPAGNSSAQQLAIGSSGPVRRSPATGGSLMQASESPIRASDSSMASSSSPQSALNDHCSVDIASSKSVDNKQTALKRKYNTSGGSKSTSGTNNNNSNYNYNDLTQQQYLTADDSLYGAGPGTGFYDPHYKRSHDGDNLYDMDATNETGSGNSNKKQPSGKKRPATSAKCGANKHQVKSSSKARLDSLSSLDGGQDEAKLKYSTAIQQAAAAASTGQPAVFGQSADVTNQHHHFYSHYNHSAHQHQQHHNHHAHLQSSAALDAAAAVDQYPAIQAAAVYAASLGHPHQAAAATGYTGSSGYHAATNGHSAQSLWSGTTASGGGQSSAALISPSSANSTYSQHHYQQQHQQQVGSRHSHTHNQLSAADAYSVQQHQHQHQHQQHQEHQQHYGSYANHHVGYGATSAASAFLPTEHALLHHYSQTAAARSAAALAGWPTNSGSQSHLTSDSSQQHSAYGSAAAASNSWGAGAAAAAAVALVAKSSQRVSDEDPTGSSTQYSPTIPTGQQLREHQYQQSTNSDHQQQQQYNSSASSPLPLNGAEGESSISPGNKQHQHAGHQMAQVEKTHGPASLNSDGSIHRSPLSSGDSSNGSSLAPVAAAATAGGATAASSLQLSPGSATHYLAPDYHHHHHHHQHQQQQQQQQQQHQSYAQQQSSYHENPYVAAQQYADFNHHQHHQAAAAAHGHHHHHHHSHHHQMIGATSDPHVAAAATYFQQVTGGHDISAAMTLGSGVGGGVAHGGVGGHNSVASSAMSAAVKLYGANGFDHHQTTAQHFSGLMDPSTITDDPSTTDQHDCWTRMGVSFATNGNNNSGDGGGYLELVRSLSKQEDQSEDNNSWLFQVKSPTTTTIAPSAEIAAEHPLERSSTADQDPAKLIEFDRDDPLARLISSTIGDIMLDISPRG